MLSQKINSTAEKSTSIDPELLAKASRIVELIASGRDKVTVTGPAGTGKTSLIKAVIDALGESVVVVAYTGQATRMLKRRGIDATTIHKLIYVPVAQSPEVLRGIQAEIATLERHESGGTRIAELKRKLRTFSQPGFALNKDSLILSARLCIIDEVSMVGRRLGEDIESFGTPLLIVGDPYQLGPVEGKAHFTLSRPDVELTKIYRQGEGSCILKLADQIRKGDLRRFPNRPSGPEVYIRVDQAMNNDDRKRWLMRADQILCSTNETRRSVNRRMLKYLGHPEKRGPDGTKDEKIICLRNNWDQGLLNGMPIKLRNIENDVSNRLFFVAEVFADGEAGWESRGRAKIYKGWFVSGLDFSEAREQADIELTANPELVECDWGYCITTHKAQGSEWHSVCFLSEHWPAEPETRRRLQYTAITRASETLDIIEGWG